MTLYTIITTTPEGSFTVSGTHWSRDSDGNLFVYDKNGSDTDPVAEVAVEHYVAIYKPADAPGNGQGDAGAVYRAIDDATDDNPRSP